MRKLALALVAVLACMAGSAHAQGYSAAAKQVIARARAASGGEAWNAVRGIHETGSLDGMRYQAWHDPVRYGARVETREPGGRRIHAFNGVADWQVLPGGKPEGSADRVILAQARTAAFIGVHGYFFPSRFGADGSHVGTRSIEGRSFDVLRVKPVDGEPRDLWFDRRTGLLARIEDLTGGTPVATELSDYRKVGPLTLAFRATTNRGGAGKAQERHVETISLAPVERELFSWTEADGAPGLDF